MAIDTRNKRASVIGLGLMFVRCYPAPDGTIDANDRRHIALGYAGIDVSDSSVGDTAIPFGPTTSITFAPAGLLIR